ncbi:MAG: OmpA family protein [Pseudomonadaceae bacterium]|jgi:OOP family OmpA-OmpF porin|nr:OmpA family protein [Pseudomonadaceae bacterium]
MNMLKTTVPFLLVAGVLSGCSTYQKGDLPMCAAIGGVTGGALGAIESSSMAGTVGLAGAVLSTAYCWVHGDADGDGVVNKTDKCPDTPKGTQVDAVGCPLPVVVEEVVEVVAVDEVIVIDNLHFAFNSANLTMADKSVLDLVAARLGKNAPNAKLSLLGFTDSVGADAYNLKLSENRAISVANYLVAAGVPQANIVAVAGAGEADPVADNATAEGRAMNRRVVIAVDN